MRLSIIIPIYNCEKEISRLLDSILDQYWEKDWYEVIACDDKSTDECMKIVNSYSDRMNIVTCTTKDRELHCPGNTRLDALSYAKGEWVTFIDNDDAFEPNVFSKIWDKIQNDSVKYALFCNIREWDDINKKYIRICSKEDTWLHGNFYNRQFLKDNNITFRENLESHEDVYFNCNFISTLISIGVDVVYFDEFVYKWIYRPDSLSRIGYSGKYLFIENYLKDYLVACIDPVYNNYLKHFNELNLRGYFFHQIVVGILHGYFYYQASLWRLGSEDEIIKRNYDDIKIIIDNILATTVISKKDIINYIIDLPELYSKIKNSCILGSNNFIEIQSFVDFINNM